MSTGSQVQQKASMELHQDLSNIATRIEATSHAGTARSTENIARWAVYLPKACIKEMIRMGWDRNT